MFNLGKMWKRICSRLGLRKEQERARAKRFKALLESAYLNGKTVDIKLPDDELTITIHPSAMPEILEWCEEWIK
jgi:hypothetical protein